MRDVATVKVTIASLDGAGEPVTMQAQRKGKNPGAVTFFEAFDDNSDSNWRRLTTTPLDGDGNATGATTSVLVRVGGVGAGTGKVQGPELGEGTLIKGPQGWKITANVGGDTSQAHKVSWRSRTTAPRPRPRARRPMPRATSPSSPKRAHLSRPRPSRPASSTRSTRQAKGGWRGRSRW